MNCPICKNRIETRKIHHDYHGPMGKVRHINQDFCPYCEWKGITGAGAQLRQIIKETTDDQIQPTGVYQD